MPSFRTKRGRCHLADGRLRVESSLRGQFERLYEGNRLIFLSYVVVVLVAVGYPVTLLLFGDLRTFGYWTGGVALLVGGAYAVNYWRGFRRDDEIPLADITRIEALEGRTGLTRPRFVVHYDRDGEPRRRYVMMPSSILSYGDDEFEQAKDAFREAGLHVES